MVLSFEFSASGAQSWVADQDYVLTGGYISGTTNNAVISSDPSLAVGSFNTPSVTQIVDNVLYYIQTNKATLPVRVPVPLGSRIYVNCSGNSSVLLYLEPQLN